MYGATTKHQKKIIKIIVCAIFLLCGIGYYFDKIYTGLASDEEMIAHFKEHRAEIEELVKRFREFEVAPNNETFDNAHEKWKQQNNTPELLQKASVSHLIAIAESIGIGDLRTLWLPNPYSIETAHKVKAINDLESWEERRPMFYKYGMIGVYIYSRKYDTEGYYTYKHFVFIPEVPRIEDGKLLSPFDINGEHYFRKPLLPYLNYFPFKFSTYRDSGEIAPCAWKQIEPQWFLRLCAFFY
jgi:hypothetical protein